MFWRKKSKEPPPIPEKPATKPPLLHDHLSPEFKQALTKELAVAGSNKADVLLSAGIGLIKAGAKELLPGWLKQFGKSDVFVLSIEQSNPETAFVFGPKDDRNYVAVFTRLELAQECLHEFPTFRFAMKLNGLDLLQLARDGQRGIWINPLNEACSVRFPATMMGRFIEEASQGRAHLGSCSTPPAPPLASGQPSDPRPLRLSIGPSPWAFCNRSTVVGAVTYRFRETAPGDGKLAGMTSVQDSSGATLLLLDCYCYARIHEDGTVLFWRESGEKAERPIIFDSFGLSSLQPVSDPLATAGEVREQKLGIAPLPKSQHWEFSPRLGAGTHSLSVPHDWSRFEETLVLADCADANGCDKAARAIFAFDWSKQRVEIFPQDWFNTGNYDFGYQWITRVARRSDGSIVGDGTRLGSFELDETHRRVKKWLTQDPFYMIQ